MSNYNETLQSNNVDLQAILETINDLPEAGNVELPELANPANEEQIFSGYETIDEDGNIKTGIFTIDNELNEQDSLIAQIQTLAEQKAIYNTIYIGPSIPTNDIGVDGDFYIVKGE